MPFQRRPAPLFARALAASICVVAIVAPTSSALSCPRGRLRVGVVTRHARALRQRSSVSGQREELRELVRAPARRAAPPRRPGATRPAPTRRELARRPSLADLRGTRQHVIVPSLVPSRRVPDPLPELRARDLGGRGVLHQVVDRRPRRCRAATPRGTAARRRRSCRTPAVGDRAAWHRRTSQQLLRRDAHIRRAACPSGCGRSPSTRVEHLARDRHEVGMRHPGAVEAVAGLALLVLAHLRERRARSPRRRVGSG